MKAERKKLLAAVTSLDEPPAPTQASSGSERHSNPASPD
jgi:hypothetical protein